MELVKLTDIEAEQRTISGMLHSETACIVAITDLDERDFSDPFNLKIFSTITSLYKANVKPTLVEVIKEGLQNKIINNVEDSDKLAVMSSQYIDDENISYWVNKVKSKSKIRQFDAMMKKYQASLIASNDAEATELINRASEEFASLSILSAEEIIQEPVEVAKVGLDTVINKMEKYREMKDQNPDGGIILDGVPTGIGTLDHLTLGFKPGDLIIFGAQTGHGKTAFALNVSDAVAVKAREPILYINTEMSKEQISLRWGAMLSGVDGDKIKHGAITNEELSIITNAYAELEQSGFYPISTPNLTPAKLLTISRIAKMRKNVKLIILDYVGRMETTGTELQEWQMLYNIIKAQKQTAQNLGLAIMVLVQLNPDGTIQGAKKMKNECDLMLRFKPVPPEEVEEYQQAKGIVYEHWNYVLEIDKNRDGASGNRIPISYDMQTQRIRQAVKLNHTSVATGWEKYERG